VEKASIIYSLRLFDGMEKNLLTTSLILSFFAHLAMIGLLSLTQSPASFFKKPFKSIEVTYQNVKALKKKREHIMVKNFKVVEKPQVKHKQKVKVLSKKSNKLSVIEDGIKDISKLSSKLMPSQKKFSKITLKDLGRKITLTPLSATKITNPKYLSYNNDMRQTISRNIKQRAYLYVNHADFETGKVYLTFVLASSGILKRVQIIDSKTSANNYLRLVAMRSIKESNPFPSFPEGFDYPEFTFNLLISFQE